MNGDKRVYTRDEFTELLIERVDDVTKIGGVIEFVESVLKLQNDMARPVYILEVCEGLVYDDVAYLDDVMNSIGVACVLVPKGMVGYVGEVDSKSFGVTNLQTDILGLKEGAVIPVGQDDEPRDDDEGVQDSERGGVD